VLSEISHETQLDFNVHKTTR